MLEAVPGGLYLHFVKPIGVERPYVALRPEGWQEDGPVILFLHGAGECGNDGLKPLTEGLPRAAMKSNATWPFLIVVPQKADVRAEWFDERDYLNAVLEHVGQHWTTDPSRRYLTGLSQGGRGTMRLAKHLSWRFAAIAPVCGWADPIVASKELADLPLWALHGEDDSVVPPSGSTQVVEAVRAAGGQAKLTLFAETGHNSWDAAYQECDLGKWLLQHQL